MAKRTKYWIFLVAFIVVLGFGIANVATGIGWLCYLDQDIEHNFVVHMGVEYGVGMGSLSFCWRCMAAGVVAIMLSIMSLWVVPTWIEITDREKDEARR